MTRFAFPFLALALAGCTTYYDPPPAAPVTSSSGAPVVSAASGAPAVSAGPGAPAVSASASTPAPVVSAAPASASKAGQGLVESISLVTLPASAAAGGTLPPVVSGPYRVTVRMDDGSIQTMIVDNRAFLVGDRVQITSDGSLIRP